MLKFESLEPNIKQKKTCFKAKTIVLATPAGKKLLSIELPDGIAIL